MNPNIKAHLALLGANLIYGINYTVAKDVMPDYIGPSGFVLIRVTGALLLFWLAASVVKKEKVEKKDLGRLFLCGMFGVAINQLFFFEGLNLTSPINAGIIMVSTPILVLLISSFLIKERVTNNKIVGILTGIAGALLLILGNTRINSSGVIANPLGDTFVFLNATSYAIYLAMVKPLMMKYNTLTVIKWVFLFGIIPVIPIGFNQATEVNWSEMPTIIWMEIAFVVFATTFLAYLLNTYALKTVTPTVSAIYIYLQPILAALIAVLAGKDQIDFIKVISTILIFIGVYLVSIRNWKSNITAPIKKDNQ
jgi:drug/metabolite transporter (DMT)-like permease